MYDATLIYKVKPWKGKRPYYPLVLLMNIQTYLNTTQSQ